MDHQQTTHEVYTQLRDGVQPINVQDETAWNRLVAHCGGTEMTQKIFLKCLGGYASRSGIELLRIWRTPFAEFVEAVVGKPIADRGRKVPS